MNCIHRGVNTFAMAADNPVNALLAMTIAPRTAPPQTSFVSLLDSAFQTSNSSSFISASDFDAEKIADALLRSMVISRQPNAAVEAGRIASGATAGLNSPIGDVASTVPPAGSFFSVAATSQKSATRSNSRQPQMAVGNLPQIPADQLFIPTDTTPKPCSQTTPAQQGTIVEPESGTVGQSLQIGVKSETTTGTDAVLPLLSQRQSRGWQLRPIAYRTVAISSVNPAIVSQVPQSCKTSPAADFFAAASTSSSAAPNLPATMIAPRVETNAQTSEEVLPQIPSDLPMSFAAALPDAPLMPFDAQKSGADVTRPAPMFAPIAFTARLTTPGNDVSPVVPPTAHLAVEDEAVSDRPLSSSASFLKETKAPISGDEKRSDVPAEKAHIDKSRNDPSPVTPREMNEIVRASASSPFEMPAETSKPLTAERASSTGDTDGTIAPRPAEPAVLENTAPAPSSAAPVQQIAVRVSPAGAPPIDLHVTERGGEIHVSVRTPDAALQTSLRQDLDTLKNSLEHAGYRADVFAPREISAPAAREMAMASTNVRGNESDPEGRGGSGNPSNGRQQQHPRQNSKNWLEELENSK